MFFKMRYSLIPKANEFYATCVVCISCLLCGVDMSFSADLISQMRDMIITIQEQSLIGSINMYARAVSSLFIAYFLNILGRKNSVLLILVCNIIAWVLMYFFSFSMIVVYISRAFSGFASGMRTPITLYVSETVHKSRRGIMISLLGLTVSLGITATYVIQYFSSWRIVALISLVVSVLGFIQTCFLKETKYWHLYKNNVEKAKESIKWFDDSLTEAEIQAEVDEILSTDSQLKDRQTNVLTALKNRTNLKYFMFGFLLLTFMFGCGRIQITAHPHNYYIQFLLPVDYSVTILIQGILELVMSVLYSCITDTVSRKTMLHFCCWVMNACLVVTLLHDILATSCGLIGQWILLVALMVFFGFACGFLLCTVTIMVAEIVSVTTESRAVFQSLLYVWANAISGVYSEVFPYALVAVPVNYIILFFFINLALLSLTGFFVPETRGKALHHCSAGKVKKASNEGTTSASEKV